MLYLFRLGLFAAASAVVVAQTAQIENPWRGLTFLIGDWTSGGGGQPGSAAGEFSFRFDLQRKVLVRRSQADYPAAAGKPSFRHEDLMIIYPEAQGKPLEAAYFDSEGHVIRYAVETTKEGDVVRFVSRQQPGAPGYRLTYRRTGGATLEGEFEVSPADKPGAYASYLKWTATKK